MGAYRDIEIDFIDRTMALLSQYEHLQFKYKHEEQYNYTLLINCMLGLIVLPKEKSFSLLPKTPRITGKLKTEMGIKDSIFHEDILTLKDLLDQLRNSVAHFHIRVESIDEEYRIDKIIFADPDNKKYGKNYIVATFIAEELLPFLRYYAGWVKHQIVKGRKAIGKEAK